MSRQLAFTLMLVCGQSLAAGTVLGALSQEDPWIWIIGGFGAAIVYVKNPPTSRSEAMINSLISVMIGGLIAPSVAAYCAIKIDKTLANPYPFAFILSSAWPWIMPAVFARARALVGKAEPEKIVRSRRRKETIVPPVVSSDASDGGEQA